MPDRHRPIKLVDCDHLPGFTEGATIDVPIPLKDIYTIKGRSMYLAAEIFTLKRTAAFDADGEAYFLDTPEFAPTGETKWASDV